MKWPWTSKKPAPVSPSTRKVTGIDDAWWGDGPLTWRTNCCKQEREDAHVDVMHVPIKGLESSFPRTRMNYRYCNDRPGCITAALTAKTVGGTT